MAGSLRPLSGFSDRRNPSAPLIKMRLENEIVRKRDVETRRAETWRSNDKYFQHWNVQNEKFDHWTCPSSAASSRQLSSRHDREDEVAQRRLELQKLYRNDRLKQEQRLIQLTKDKENGKWEQMRHKVEQFRQCRTTKLEKLVQMNEHEKWKTSSDSYKAFESELKNQQLQEIWQKQKQMKEREKIKLAEEKETEKLIMEQTLERDRAKEEMERKLSLTKKLNLKEALEQQMELLRKKDAVAKEKKKEYETLIAKNLALEIVEDKLRAREEERLKKKQIREFLTKQHLAKLRQRSREVAAQLELEKGFAEQIFCEKDSSKSKEEVLLEIKEYLQLVEQHKQFEKERQKQTEFLFQEEARMVWDKMEKEWESERLARKQLIEQVVYCQKKQIENKMEETRREREQLIDDREEIMRAVEMHNNELEMKHSQDNVKKLQLKHDLLSQMEEKSHWKTNQREEERQEQLHQKNLQVAFEEKHWALEMDRLKL